MSRTEIGLWPGPALPFVCLSSTHLDRDLWRGIGVGVIFLGPPPEAPGVIFARHLTCSSFRHVLGRCARPEPGVVERAGRPWAFLCDPDKLHDLPEPQLPDTRRERSHLPSEL